MVAFSFTIKDPNGAYTFEEAQILRYAKEAASIWEGHLLGSGTIDVQLSIDPTVTGLTLATTSSGTFVDVGQAGGLTIATPVSVYKTQTGSDPNGAAPDIIIAINPNALSEITSYPTALFLHELAHGLGFTGYRNGITGSLTGTVETPFDSFVVNSGGSLYFTGKNAEAANNGAPVLLESGDYGHVANLTDLMYGTLNNNGILSDIDVGILRDIGLRVTSPNDYVLHNIGSNDDIAFTGSFDTILDATRETGGIIFDARASTATDSSGGIHRFDYSSFGTFVGGSGNDTFILGGYGVRTNVDGGPGINILDWTGENAVANVNLSSGAIWIVSAVAGNSNFSNIQIFKGNGSDTFIGGAGNHSIQSINGGDTFDYSAAPVGIKADLISGTIVNGYGGIDQLVAASPGLTPTIVSTLSGSAYDDTYILNSTIKDITIYTGAGNDTLVETDVLRGETSYNFGVFQLESRSSIADMMIGGAHRRFRIDANTSPLVGGQEQMLEELKKGPLERK